jgi:cytochrome P450
VLRSRFSVLRGSPAKLLFLSVLPNPHHVQAVFGDSDKHFKAVNSNSGYIMSRVLRQCVGLINGREWQAARAVTEVPVSRRQVAQHFPMIYRHLETYMKTLESGENLRAGFIHPANDLKRLPFRIVAEINYGELLPHLTHWLKSLVPLREDLFKHVVRGGPSRFAVMRFFPTEPGRKLVDFKCSGNPSTKMPSSMLYAPSLTVHGQVRGGYVYQSAFGVLDAEL